MNSVLPETEAPFRLRAVTALGFFLVIQLVGTFLRFLPLNHLPVNYTFVLYGHTHASISGWIGASVYLCLQFLLPPPVRSRKVFTWIWWLSQLGVVGMLLSFPFQGYKAVSIAFSTLVILMSYAYAVLILRHGRQHQDLGWSCIRWSLLFMFLSSLGPWSLGPMMVRFPNSPWIKLAVYFYLHFLYNGFFTFVVLGLLLRWLSAQGLGSDEGPGLRLQLLAWACLPAYALSTLWIHPPAWVWVVAAVAAGIQLLALAGLARFLHRAWSRLKLSSRWSRVLLGISLLSFGLKFVLQAITAHPYFAALAAANRHLLIGYLHLVFLGFVSCFLLAWLIEHGLLKLSAWGLGIFLTGLILSESWLFGNGLMQWLQHAHLPGFAAVMLAVTALMPLGTALLLQRQFRASAR